MKGREPSRPELLHQCTKPCTEMTLAREEEMDEVHKTQQPFMVLCHATSDVWHMHTHQLTLHAASLSVSEPDTIGGTWILGSGNGTHI